MTKPRYNSNIVRSHEGPAIGANNSAFVLLEFKPLKPAGQRRRWSRTLRPILVGSSVHRAVEGAQGPYFDFLRDMYRKPKENK